MADITARSTSRGLIVKIAKDAFVHRMAAQFISQFQDKLNHLQEGDKFDPAADGVPIGKDLFVDWIKNELNTHRYVELRGLLENTPLLKQYALQVADAIGKSSTNIKNPMKDYGITDAEIFEVKAESQGAAMQKKADNKNLYTVPTERSRYCPDHPGSMLRRVSDNTYQCPIEGTVYSSGPWKDQFNYRGGHEVKFEVGVENQTTPAWNKMHPLPSFLNKEPKESEIAKSKSDSLDADEIYDVFEDNDEGILPSSPASNKEASVDFNLTKVSKKIKRQDGSFSERGLWDNIRANRGSGKKPSKEILEQAEAITQTASNKTASDQLFAPTTMTSRQCPDHPGQQLIRIEDNVRQCGLDGKVYDFTRGFNTYDGAHHNGGSIQGQSAFASHDDSLAKIARKAVVTAQDSQKLTQLLYQILQYLPADSRERKVLNYKFSNNTSIESAIAAIEEHERLQKQTPAPTPTATPTSPPAAKG